MNACCTTSSGDARLPTIPRAMANSRRVCVCTARSKSSSDDGGIPGCLSLSCDTRWFGKSCGGRFLADRMWPQRRKERKECDLSRTGRYHAADHMPNPLANSFPLVQVPTPAHLAPRVYVENLDHLWFQLTGTLCNLTCTHCFISCSPSNHSFGFLDYDKVLAALADSKRLGVKEYYFTGGEPFMHPRVLDILEQTLGIGPATVLSNGTLFREKTVERLARIRDASI